MAAYRLCEKQGGQHARLGRQGRCTPMHNNSCKYHGHAAAAGCLVPAAHLHQHRGRFTNRTHDCGKVMSVYISFCMCAATTDAKTTTPQQHAQPSSSPPSGSAKMSPVLASPADNDTSSRALFKRPEPAAALTVLLKVNSGWLPGTTEAAAGLTAWPMTMSGVRCRHTGQGRRIDSAMSKVCVS